MRRLPAAVVVAALAVLTLLAAVPAVADQGPADVLAAEAGMDGPEPMPRDADDNPARELAGYEDRETPFTWGAAWILLFTGTVGLVLLVGLYQLLVRRPSRQGSSA